MKVLVYGAQYYSGAYLIQKLRKAGHIVVGIYINKEMDYISSVSHIKYKVLSPFYDKNNNSVSQKLEEIIKYECPQGIICAIHDIFLDENKMEAVISVVSTLARLSDKYKTSNFTYISSFSVYGDTLTDSQKTMHLPLLVVWVKCI